MASPDLERYFPRAVNVSGKSEINSKDLEKRKTVQDRVSSENCAFETQNKLPDEQGHGTLRSVRLIFSGTKDITYDTQERC